MQTSNLTWLYFFIYLTLQPPNTVLPTRTLAIVYLYTVLLKIWIQIYESDNMAFQEKSDLIKQSLEYIFYTFLKKKKKEPGSKYVSNAINC